MELYCFSHSGFAHRDPPAEPNLNAIPPERSDIRKWVQAAPWCPQSRLPGIGDASYQSVCSFRRIWGDDDLHRVEFNNTALQFRARWPIRERVN